MNLQYYDDLWRAHQPDQADQADFWNRRAFSFNAHKSESDDSGRLALTERVAAKACLDSADRVLDIGCGSGHYALLFARRVAEVFGFDIAPKMIEFARQNAAAAGCANAHFEELDWRQTDLRAVGWEKRFKLVFACKTPAVNDLATLKKMMAASSGSCCLISKEDAENSIRDRLKPLLRWDDEEVRIGRSFYCAFNILWLLGYYPEVWYEERSWESDLELDDALMMYMRYFGRLGVLRPEDKNAAVELVASLAVGGRIREKVKSKVVVMFWDV